MKSPLVGGQSGAEVAGCSGDRFNTAVSASLAFRFHFSFMSRKSININIHTQVCIVTVKFIMFLDLISRASYVCKFHGPIAARLL